MIPIKNIRLGLPLLLWLLVLIPRGQAQLPDSGYVLSVPPQVTVDQPVTNKDFSKLDFCDCPDSRLGPIVNERQINTSWIEARSKESAFHYDRTIKDEANSFWDQFWDWLMRKIFGNISERTAVKTMNVIYWIIGVLGVLLVGYWLYQSEFHGSPLKSGTSITEGMISETSRSESDLDAAMEEALKQQNYALAVRWLYIITIKWLSDQRQITLRQDKTNYDYIQELKHTEQRQAFKQLTRIFEFSTYGKFETTQSHWSESLAYHQQLKSRTA